MGASDCKVRRVTHVFSGGNPLRPEDRLRCLRPFVLYSVGGFEQCLSNIEVRSFYNPICSGVVAAYPDVLHVVLLFQEF